MISIANLERLSRDLTEGPRKSRIVEYGTLEALVKTAQERHQLQAILTAALQWYGAVESARNEPAAGEGKPSAEQMKRIDDTLEALHAAVYQEVQLKIMSNQGVIKAENLKKPVTFASLPGLGGLPFKDL